MGPSRKRAVSQTDPTQQEIREQEALRANRELAAYFRGRRTEREARAALKIIKAFIRDRERIDPASRRPLPGAPSASGKTNVREQKTHADEIGPRRQRNHEDRMAKGADAQEATAAPAPALSPHEKHTDG